MPAGDKWVDRNAGPVVRPYALTGGRTRPSSGAVLDLITVIVASSLAPGPDDALPLGVVRVLIADLIGQGRVTVLAQRPVGEEPSTAMLKEVLNGLRAL